MILEERLAAASQELATKTLYQVQCETAFTWACRAWTAYANAAQEQAMHRIVGGDVSAAKRQAWLHDATEYEHEALEQVLAEVGRIVDWGRSLAG